MNFNNPFSILNSSNINNLNLNTIKALERNLALVDDLTIGIKNKDYDIIGEVFNKSWENKFLANPKSIPINLIELRDILLKAGVKGVKIMGAGGGGFLAVWMSGDREQVIRKIKEHQINIFPIRIIDESLSIVDRFGEQ